MWRATTWIIGLFVLITALGFAKDTSGVDPVKAAPDHYKVIFENERMRVLSFHSRPGEEWPLHVHPDAVTVFVCSSVQFNCDSKSNTKDETINTIRFVAIGPQSRTTTLWMRREYGAG